MPSRDEPARSLGLVRILTLHCRDAATLTSAGLDRRLSPTERIGLGLHRLICASCRQFADQVRLIRTAMARVGDDPERAGGQSLTPEAWSRIRDAVEQALRRP